MAIYKVVKANYNSRSDFHNLINYVLDDSRHVINGFVGATGINCSCGYHPMVIEKTLLSNKKYFNKISGRMAKHLLISLSDEEMKYISPYQLLQIGYQIAQSCFSEFMTVFSIHHEKEHLHLHMVIDTVSFVTGKKFQESQSEFIMRKEYAKNLVASYLPCRKMIQEIRRGVDDEYEFIYTLKTMNLQEEKVI